MLAVTLFGHLRISCDGKDVRFAVRPKVAPLLAYLLLNRNKPVSRDSVAFALWPDEPEESARANLRRHLHYLREALPSVRIPCVIADARTLHWNPAARVNVDVDDFEHFAADAASLEKAIGLYGELLQGYEDEWLIAARERLHDLYVQSLWELVRRARSRRDGTAANDYLGRILADDPWREDAVRALMAVRCESGDSTSALQICSDFEARLRREMAAALMPETVALRRAIERGNPLPSIPVVPETRTAIVSTIDLPFEGRTDELKRLRGSWQDTLGGSGALALVVGEAGIGKTRLVSEFAIQAEAMGARVFWGTTSSPETVPYQPITEILRAAVGFIELSRREGYDLDVLARVVPELQNGEFQTDPGGEPPAEKLFDVVADLFIELAQPRPALFVLEDLHAAGQATIAMLEHVARRCLGHPVLIVATLREEEPSTPDILGRLRRPQKGVKPSTIPLGPLSEMAARSIAAQSLGKGTDASRVAARAGGHPLFLAQLVYAAEAQAIGVDALPAGLRESIDARTERLSPTASFLLRAAAVAGNAFDLEIICESLGWSESQLTTAADELIARRLIRETARSRAFDYEFAHDLIASAAYDSVPELERRRRHRRIARAAEHWYASRLSDFSAFVARHFELGGERDSAVVYYLRAAQRAARAFANEEALAYSRRALGLQPSSPVDRYELLSLTEEVLGLMGERADQAAILRKLERVARSLGDVQRRLEVLRRRATLHQYLGERDAWQRSLARLYELAKGNARWEAVALTGQALSLNHSGLRTDAHKTITQATGRAAEANDGAVLAEVLLTHTDIAASLGLREEAESCLRRLKHAAASVGSTVLIMRATLSEMIVAVHFQDWPRVVASAPRALDLAATVGSKNTAASAHTALACALGSLLDLQSARDHLRAAIELYRGRNVRGRFLAYNNLARIEMLVGRVDNAQRVLDEIAEAFPETSIDQRAMANLIASELARHRGNFSNAIALADSAISVASENGNALFEAEAVLCKGRSLRASGRFAEAMAPLERCTAIHRGSGLTAQAQRAIAELTLACALAGDARTATLADEILASLQSGGAEPDLLALWPLSQALTAIGRTAEGRKILSRAHDEFQKRLKRLRSRRDRMAFSQLRENVELERAYASVAATSPGRDASAESPPVRRGRKTRSSDPTRPPAHSP